MRTGSERVTAHRTEESGRASTSGLCEAGALSPISQVQLASSNAYYPIPSFPWAYPRSLNPRFSQIPPFLLLVVLSVGLGRTLRGELTSEQLILGVSTIVIVVALVKAVQVNPITEWLRRRRGP